MATRESGDALAAYQLDSGQELVQSILIAAKKCKSVFESDKGELLTLEERQTQFDPFCPAFKPTVQMASYIERLEMTGVANFGGVSELIIPPQGDFLSDLTICMALPKLIPTDGYYADWTSAIAHVLPRKVTLYLGNLEFDALEGDWLELLDEIDVTDRQWSGNCAQVGRFESPLLVTSQSADDPVQRGEMTYYSRLRFGFTDALNLSVPIISLPFTQIRLKIEWQSFDQCITYDGDTPPLFQPITHAWVNAMFTKLDTTYSLPIYNYRDANLAYLYRTMHCIEKMLPAGATNTQIPLSEIKLPVAGLVFVIRTLEAEENNDWFNFAIPDGTATPILKTARMTVDSYERYPCQDETFYRTYLSNRFVKRSPRNYIYIMPFAKKLLEINEASGTLDFSRIKNPTLWLTLSGDQSAVRIKVFALMYNIVGIRKGQIIVRS